MVIRTAQSVIEEVPQAASSSLQVMGRCDRRNPERAVQNMTKKFNLRIPIPLSDIQVGDDKVPILKMSDWARFLMSMNPWHTLCGLQQPDEERCSEIWSWDRYKAIHPNHMCPSITW